ncbi:Uncharacterised protein [Salmonella enterica subsp. indica]|uniref:Uncharacterized protein n=2 Tax=Salmonella enterica TaxID=28901 RepID=A0A702EDQ9_SALER|nr:hypothetical protein [Salmonella enterica subsp. indica serovar 11:b:e,n,x]ECC3878845.1 hypothetical protein [Salmonella enterica subsp. indica]SUI04530.1 Uncharacterised protein [Salmonella enterica subsp. indica]HAC6576730.1 hypothetical protein [Salmonella enterica subsp. indica]
MKKILKKIISAIYHDFISPHFLVVVFVLTFFLSYHFLSDYNGVLPILLSIIVTCAFSFIFDKYL